MIEQQIRQIYMNGIGIPEHMIGAVLRYFNDDQAHLGHEEEASSSYPKAVFTGNEEWYTPPEFLDAARDALTWDKWPECEAMSRPTGAGRPRSRATGAEELENRRFWEPANLMFSEVLEPTHGLQPPNESRQKPTARLLMLTQRNFPFINSRLRADVGLGTQRPSASKAAENAALNMRVCEGVCRCSTAATSS